MTRQQPLYQQLAATLEGEIQEGKWKPGDRLPTETELMQAHNLGRITVRHALNLLRNKRLIERFPHRGSIVTDPNLIVGVRSLDSINEVVQLGLETQTKITNWCTLPPPPSVAVFFGKGQDTVYQLRGTRQKFGVPVYVVTSYIREDIGAGIQLEMLAEHTPLEIIRDFLKIPLAHGDEEVWAQGADQEVANQLQIPDGSIVIAEQRRLYGQHATPLLLASTWWRTDQYRRIYKITR